MIHLDYTGIRPLQATPGSAGMDLFTDIPTKRMIDAFHVDWIPTGTAVAIPAGHFGLVLPRSSTFKSGLYVHPGTIDSDYRGEIKLGLRAFDREVIIEPNQRLAQLIILPAASVTLMAVDELPESTRGESGFGSTGR